VLVVLGPLCAAAAVLFGRFFGAELGMVAGAIVMAILGILLWIVVAAWRNGATGAAAASVWMFAGALNVHAGNSLDLLESGAHVVGAHVADVSAWRGHERVTFGDGALRGDLTELAGHVAKRVDGNRTSRFDYCEATPIVPDGWQDGEPVRLWSLDDSGTSLAFADQTFRVVSKPDEDCSRAIESSIAKHHLVRAADQIFLERVETSTDPVMLRVGGYVAAAFTALIWLGVLGWRWIGDLRDRRTYARRKREGA
jgi:hypothetical protein